MLHSARNVGVSMAIALPSSMPSDNRYAMSNDDEGGSKAPFVLQNGVSSVALDQQPLCYINKALLLLLLDQVAPYHKHK